MASFLSLGYLLKPFIQIVLENYSSYLLVAWIKRAKLICHTDLFFQGERSRTRMLGYSWHQRLWTRWFALLSQRVLIEKMCGTWSLNCGMVPLSSWKLSGAHSKLEVLRSNVIASDISSFKKHLKKFHLEYPHIYTQLSDTRHIDIRGVCWTIVFVPRDSGRFSCCVYVKCLI